MAVVLSGDLQQLGPVKGRYVFDKPIQEEQYFTRYLIDPLWERFKCMSLTINHRQGKDREYAEMLNRIRVGEQSVDDVLTLASRFNRSPPKDTISHLLNLRPEYPDLSLS